MFRLVEGRTKKIPLPVTASTAITQGSLVVWDSGLLIAATSTTDAKDTVGVLVKTIATTDSDYAVAGRLVEVEVPIENHTIWEAPVTTGLVSNDIGLFQDLTDGLTVNRAASTYDVVQCVRVLSTTKGHFFLNIGNAGFAGTT